MQEKILNGMAYIAKICISGIIAILLLCIFTLVYGYSGVHVKNETGATDYRWEAGQWRTTMAEGFSWLRMDKTGFNNTYQSDADENIDILLMGSSQMEAVNVGANQNVGYLLNDLLSEYTYNIGISGHSIYSCVKNIESAVAQYQPSEYVILETDKIDLSEEDMKSVIDGQYATIPSYDSGLIYMVQKKLPAIKSLYNNISDWRDFGLAGDDSEDVKTDSYTEEYGDTLDFFMQKAVSPLQNSEAKLIIFYHPSTTLDSEGNLITNTDATALDLFERTCQKNGIIFVDVTADFQKLYMEQHRLPYGFSNTEVGKGHLNKYGHKVIADRLAQIIQADQQKEEDGEGIQ
jgi:hypothetical protein